LTLVDTIIHQFVQKAPVGQSIIYITIKTLLCTLSISYYFMEEYFKVFCNVK